jgi:hypothetical protein
MALALDENSLHQMAACLLLKPEAEIRLDAGQGIEIPLPSIYSQRELFYVRFSARRTPIKTLKTNEWDENPAYLCLEALNPETGQWQRWSDQYGERKFIARSTSSIGNIFHNIAGNFGFSGIQRIRLINVGGGDSTLTQILIQSIGLFFTLPDKDSDTAAAPDQSCNPIADARSNTSASSGANPRYFTELLKPSSFKVTFPIDSALGKEMVKGEIWRFPIPPEYQNLQINSILIKHRKEPELFIGKKEGWDDNPVYLQILAHDPVRKGCLPWYDRFGSEKFCEPRTPDDPETDNLHDCLSLMGKFNADFIEIRNLGKGDPAFSKARIHELSISFLPSLEETLKQIAIFTDGTEFIDPGRAILTPVLAGGPRFQGRFPDSVMLGTASLFRLPAMRNTPEPFSFRVRGRNETPGLDSRHRLHIPLIPGRKILSLELAVGDVDNTDTSLNKDNHVGRLGAAEIYVFLSRAAKGPSHDHFADMENVPPAGVLWFFPLKADYVVQPGDELIIHSIRDVTFLMGYRVCYK